MTTSHRFLKLLAALVWYGGAIALLLKAGSLFMEARTIRPDSNWLWMAIAAGFAAGLAKAATLFSWSCRRNLSRIDGLEEPKLWQFFRPRFFLALALMISLGVTLSKLSHGHFSSLLAVGALDLSISTALFGSSYNFWKQRSPALCNPST